jgi:hypothetical protein
MLARERLSTAWCILYFLNPGALYYSQTLMAAVPAAVMGLLGVSLLMRPAPRTALGGLALGCAVLLHPWMGPLVVVFSAVWVVENGRILKLLIGAAPAIALLAAYNYLITDSPLRSGYWVLGHQHNFNGPEFASFAPFYLVSLAILPLGIWAVLSPRWTKGWAVPAASAVTLLMGSLYYYRDGLNLQSHGIIHLLAGAIPGQRFLLPVSLLACVPAARWLDSIISKGPIRFQHFVAGLAGAGFVVCFLTLSAVHQGCLRAHATVQQALDRAVPVGSQVVVLSDLAVRFGGCKELAPVYGIRRCIELDRSDKLIELPKEAFVMWAGPPGAPAPRKWFSDRDLHVIKARSWMWNADIWLGALGGVSAGS